jgi:hypothetical protein
MPATRTTFGTLLLLAVAAVSLLSIGCPPPKKTTTVKGKQTTGEEASSKEKEKTAPPEQTAKQFGEEFLKAVTEGKATPDQLTVSFKKLAFAMPKFADEEKLGYSDTDAKLFLKKSGNPVYTIDQEVSRTKPVPHAVFRGKAKVADKSEGFALRVVKNPETSKWQVDLFYEVSTGSPGPIAEDSDAAIPKDTLQTFMDSLLFGDLKLAAAMMSPNLKKSTAPPFSTDKGGFNPGFLELQLKDRRALYNGYAYTTPAGSSESYTFTVEMRGNRPEKLTVKLIKDKATGSWLVDSL